MNTRPAPAHDARRSALDCKPSLAGHWRVREQLIRQRSWAVVQNTVSGTFLRIDSGLWQAVLQLQGDCSLRDWLAQHESRFDRVSLLESVTHLQRHGLLHGMPGGQKPAAPARKPFNPLMLKLALCNPSTLLSRLAGYSRKIKGRAVMLTMLALFSLAMVLGLLDSDRLLADWDRVLTAPEQWWQYLLLYPCLKCLHELSHGLVLKRLGGDVREAGLSLLVLMPVPYVNATDVWALPRRRDRIAVTAAGMLCDLSLASVAMILWYTLQAGVLTDMAFAVMLMGGVSVVMFNANPLLKFDGYYLLEDLLDSPGLARRSTAYWQYLFKRYLFAAERVMRPLVEDGERRYLLPYGAASLVYRVLISLTISLFLISQLHEIGMILAAFSIVPLFIRPLPRLMIYLTRSAQLQGQRLRASARLLLLCALVAVPVVLLPLPSSTRAEGIVWSRAQTELYAPEDAFIAHWLVENGESVVAGQPLAELQAPELVLQKQRLESQIALLLLDHAAQRRLAPERAHNTRIDIDRRRETLQDLQQRIAMLSLVAPRAGRVAFAQDALLAGQSVSQGELLIFLVDDEPVVVRAVVDQRQLGKLQSGVTQAQVRLADDIATVLPASLSRQSPAGNKSLPSMALANNGFGGIDVRSVEGNMQTLEEVFHLELALAERVSAHSHGVLGGRAFITLKHPPETLARRWWRGSRQLFLKHLGT